MKVLVLQQALAARDETEAFINGMQIGDATHTKQAKLDSQQMTQLG